MAQMAKWRKKLLKKVKSVKFFMFVLWLAWLFVGTVFYSYNLNLGWSEGFYMAVNVGYSIGWGDISEYGEPASQWFSTLYLLCGASFVAAALGLFAQKIVDDKNNWYTHELQRIAHEKYVEENKNNAHLLAVAASSSSNHWSFIEALYFAVSSLSTGGLYALPTDSESWKYSMTGFYAAVGVPVGGLAMATIAGFFINTGDINHTIDAIRESVTEEEVNMLTKFDIANDDGVIDKAEFMILCMVRTGSASPALIKMIGEYYNELDLDHDGSLTMDEICQRAKVDRAAKPSRRRSMALVEAKAAAPLRHYLRDTDSDDDTEDQFNPMPKTILKAESTATTDSTATTNGINIELV